MMMTTSKVKIFEIPKARHRIMDKIPSLNTGALAKPSTERHKINLDLGGCATMRTARIPIELDGYVLVRSSDY